MNNYFGLTDDKITKNVQQGFPIAVDNICTLEKCEYQVTDSGKECIDFVYKMTDGDTERSLRDRRWAVDEASVTTKDGQTIEEALKAAWGRKNAELRHIATKFNCTDQELKSAGGNNYKEYATNYCNLIMNKIKAKNPKLYIKTYNKNGYCAVGVYPNFLQREDSGACTLQWTKEEERLNHLVKGNGVIASTDVEHFV